MLAGAGRFTGGLIRTEILGRILKQVLVLKAFLASPAPVKHVLAVSPELLKQVLAFLKLNPGAVASLLGAYIPEQVLALLKPESWSSCCPS